MGCTKLVPHRIDTGDTRPIKQALRRVPVHLQAEFDKHLQDMLERGVVNPSSSPWPAPVVLVRKKDRSIRYCADYRRLSENTVSDAYPLPTIDETLELLAGAQWELTNRDAPRVSLQNYDKERAFQIPGRGVWFEKFSKQLPASHAPGFG